MHGKIDECHGKGGEQGTHEINTPRDFQRVIQGNHAEDTSKEEEQGIAGSVRCLQLIGGCDEFRAVPKASGRLKRIPI